MDCRGFGSIISFHIFRILLEINFSQNHKYLIINYLNTSCGVVNKFLTIINDLFEAYLIGIQLSIEQILMAELLLSFEHTMTLTCGCVEELVSLLR